MNTIEENIEIEKEKLIKSTEEIIKEDGNYYTIEQIKESIPYGDELLYKILYLRFNDKILTDDEKDKVKLEIQRINKSNSIRIKPDLKQIETVKE